MLLVSRSAALERPLPPRSLKAVILQSNILLSQFASLSISLSVLLSVSSLASPSLLDG